MADTKICSGFPQSSDYFLYSTAIQYQIRPDNHGPPAEEKSTALTTEVLPCASSRLADLGTDNMVHFSM